MEIEKLHLICPKCFAQNEGFDSTVKEKLRCSKCGVSSNTVDFKISSKSNTDGEHYKNIEIKQDGENWVVTIKPWHRKFASIYFAFGVAPLLFGVYELIFSNNFGLILILLGLFGSARFLYLLIGKVKFTLVNNTLKYFYGIGKIGFYQTLKWSEIEYVSLDEFFITFSLFSKKYNKYSHKTIVCELSFEASSYLGRFFKRKLEIRNTKSLGEKFNELQYKNDSE